MTKASSFEAPSETKKTSANNGMDVLANTLRVTLRSGRVGAQTALDKAIPLKTLIEQAGTEAEKRQGAEAEDARVDDALVEQELEELWRASPEVVWDMCLDSLARGASMMREIVEDTRADLEIMEARRVAIDRTQAETRAILNEVMERMK